MRDVAEQASIEETVESSRRTDMDTQGEIVRSDNDNAMFPFYENGKLWCQNHRPNNTSIPFCVRWHDGERHQFEVLLLQKVLRKAPCSSSSMVFVVSFTYFSTPFTIRTQEAVLS